MNKPRCQLSAAEVAELHARLDRRLDSIGLETQPKVAARLVQLSQDREAQLRHYAEVIQTDWTLAARILKMANSAFYAQRSPVTKLERALVIIGLERTKAMSLGFYLSRGAVTPTHRELSRAVWGESVFRAGLCAALARQVCPGLAAEAFIVGLMLDCGQALMPALSGEAFVDLRRQHASPAKLFTTEFNALEFTHVDVAIALLKRWKLPALLSRPIGWHHSLPTTGKTADPAAMLHRVAYYAGAVQLSPAGVPESSAPLASIAGRLFEIGAADLAALVSRATGEYRATIEIFADVADAIGSTDQIADAVQRQLVDLMDEQLSRALHAETKGGPQRLVLSGQQVEIEPGRAGEVVAVIRTAEGDRIITCTVRPNTDGPEVLCARLGLDPLPPHEAEEFLVAARAMAA